MANNYAKGSIWRKWDLHIHSPLTILNNGYPKADSSPDWEGFLSKLESLDLAVIAITDYFSIEGYKKLKEFKTQGRLSNIDTILPNIEFRLNSVISSKKDGKEPRRLNFHIIFSDEVSVKDIEEHFLHDIDFFYEGNPQDQDDTRKLKLSNIEELGKKLIHDHKKFKESGLSPLEIGAMNAVVSHESITKGLNNSRFKGKYILVFPEELSSLIDWDGQDHHIRKGLLQKSDMVFSSNARTRSWCLGKDPYTEGVDKFIEEFKTCKPCIHGSDAHKVDEIGHPCAFRGVESHDCSDNCGCELRYCWIKADPTFEGLKQLLYEPDDRVMIQQDDPTPIKSNYTLTNIKITPSAICDELSIQATDIPLNTGLIAVTGGKGSGKTALVDLIANCYKDRCNTSDPNSFVKRIADHNPALTTTLTFRDGNTFAKDIKNGMFFEDSEIVYVAQGELEHYIGADSDLDVHIKSLIFDSPQVKDTVISFEFDELLAGIDQIQENIIGKNKEVINLEKQTSEDVLQKINVDLKQKDAELKDVETRLNELEKALSPDKIQIAKDKQKKIATLKLQRDDLVNLKNLLIKSLHFIIDDVVAFNETILQINTLLTQLEISEAFDTISYKHQRQLTTRLEIVKAKITEIVQRIEVAQKALQAYESGVRDHAKLLEGKRELKALMAALLVMQTRFATNKELLKTKIEDRKELLSQLIEAVILQKKKYAEIIKAFSAQKAEVLSDLTFDVKIQFITESFKQAAEEIMDNRKVVVSAGGRDSIFNNLLALIDSILNGNENIIANFVEEIEKLNREYRSKIKTSQAITIGDFYNFLYGNYFGVVPTVKYKNTSLTKLSLGQKATVLIKIYLAQGDKPIIIDSHDDHLDNEYIMDELVKSIRQAKSHRQIFLASNNGNVVINSDAEQIIIAQRTDGKIAYISGSIENPIIRERALKVLEGGRDAFRQRQWKYRLNT